MFEACETPKSVTYISGTSARCGPWSQGLLGTTWKIQTFLLVEPMLKMNRFSHFFQHIIDIHKNVLESFYIHKNVLESFYIHKHVLESFFSETIAFNV